MRGYFGIGVEGISKPMNLGNLLRSAHAFGASFFFTVSPAFGGGVCPGLSGGFPLRWRVFTISRLSS